MSFLKNQYEAFQSVTSGDHSASLSHELLGAAAAYEATKAYEHHVAKNGQPANHAQAKEIIAAAAGAFIDRIVETKGLNFVDKEKAKRHAQQQAETSLQNSGQF